MSENMEQYGSPSSSGMEMITTANELCNIEDVAFNMEIEEETNAIEVMEQSEVPCTSSDQNSGLKRRWASSCFEVDNNANKIIPSTPEDLAPKRINVEDGVLEPEPMQYGDTSCSKSINVGNYVQVAFQRVVEPEVHLSESDESSGSSGSSGSPGSSDSPDSPDTDENPDSDEDEAFELELPTLNYNWTVDLDSNFVFIPAKAIEKLADRHGKLASILKNKIAVVSGELGSARLAVNDSVFNCIRADRRVHIVQLHIAELEASLIITSRECDELQIEMPDDEEQ